MTAAGTVEKPAKVNFNADDLNVNMYGCLPCPKCGSKYRASYSRGPIGHQIECDSCGFFEPAVIVE